MNWRPPLRGCHAPTRPRHSGWPDASFPAWPPWTPRPGSAVTEGATADLEDNLPSRDCPGRTAPKERTRRHTPDGRRAATVPPRRTGRHGMRAGTDRVPGWTRRPAAARLALAALVLPLLAAAAVEVGITLFVASAVEEAARAAARLPAPPPPGPPGGRPPLPPRTRGATASTRSGG